jgi:hypothetical protein
MRRYNQIMEKFWLVIAIVSFIYGVYMVGKIGLAQGGMYLIMSFVAVALFYLRYYANKRYKKEDQKDA